MTRRKHGDSEDSEDDIRGVGRKFKGPSRSAGKQNSRECKPRFMEKKPTHKHVSGHASQICNRDTYMGLSTVGSFATTEIELLGFPCVAV